MTQPTITARYRASDGFTEAIESTDPCAIAAFYRKWVGSSDTGTSDDGVGRVSLKGITIADIDRVAPPVRFELADDDAARDKAVDAIGARGDILVDVDRYFGYWRIRYQTGRS